MHTSRIKLFKGFQIEVTVTRFDDQFCSFTHIRAYGLDQDPAASLFAEWIDQRAGSCRAAFQHAFDRAHVEIARKRENKRENKREGQRDRSCNR